MEIFWIILGLGQIMNIYKFIKLNSWKSFPGLRENLYSENMLMRTLAQQHHQSIQTQGGMRFLGIFLCYGAIWGWIDIINYLRGAAK